MRDLKLPHWPTEIRSWLVDEKIIEEYFDRLWPICRSITGNGFRSSLEILSGIAEYDVIETPSGTKAFDWIVPKEWNISDAYVENESGQRIIDFKSNNLHVLNYSIPVDAWVTLDELQAHLYSLPEQPDAIPYLTTYYQERWGFCLTDNQRKTMAPGRYHAVIRATLDKGSLSIGQKILPATIPNKNPREILISSNLCHPSLANNELSGPLVTSFLYKALRSLKDRRFTYRFVIVPETIGAIVYLSKYGEELKARLHAGLVATCVGDDRKITYKKSRNGNSVVDRATLRELEAYGKPFEVIDFFPSGSDERQYCSPGFDLPVGSLFRTMYGAYPEYHTSLDNKSSVSFKAIKESIELYLRVFVALEANHVYQSTSPYCEPMLSPRGLYPTLGSQKQNAESVDHMMWILNQADGTRDLIDIAQKAKCSVLDLDPIARLLVERGLLRKAD